MNLCTTVVNVTHLGDSLPTHLQKPCTTVANVDPSHVASPSLSTQASHPRGGSRELKGGVHICCSRRGSGGVPREIFFWKSRLLCVFWNG